MTRNADIAKMLGRSEKDNAGNQSLVTPGRNLIINGAMQVAQRGTSSTGVTSGGYETVDRFRVAYNGTPDELEVTHEQSTDAPTGFSNSFKLTVTTAETTLAADERIRLQQRIEGQNLQHLKYGTSDAEYLTLSFYVKSNVTGTYGIHFENRDSSRSICSSYTISAANTWEKKTVSIAGDTTGSFDNDNARSLDVCWVLAAGTDYTSGTFATSWESDTNANQAPSGQADITDTISNYFQITGVQLEVGETATPFEHKPYVQDMTECLRYFNRYRKTNSYGEFVTLRTYSATQGTGLHQFPTPMRAAPTLTIDKTVNNTYFAYNLNAISITGTDGNFTSCGFHATSASNSFVTGGGAVIQSNAVQDISFNLDAEL